LTRTFTIATTTRPKKDGGRREIAEPDAPLKRVQYQIIARYFKGERPHAAAVAYQKGKSTADHVWAHAGAEVVVTADVQDFFPSTRADRVEDWWRERVDDDTARLLTLLTTLRGGLPQGAPTSPGLSNFVNGELDARLARRAEAAGARYTRYCDDLAFSWPNGGALHRISKAACGQPCTSSGTRCTRRRDGASTPGATNRRLPV